MTNADFEDPRQFARCSRSDCEAYRAGGTPLCAQHLREQETSSPGIIEPDLEARVAGIRSEDDEHPGQKKVWLEDGTFEWVHDPDWQPPTKPVRDPEVVTSGAAGIHRAFAPVGMPSSDRIVEWATAETPIGCWLAHAPDWSSLTLFDDELEALRYAVSEGMSVIRAVWGLPMGPGVDSRQGHG